MNITDLKPYLNPYADTGRIPPPAPETAGAQASAPRHQNTPQGAYTVELSPEAREISAASEEMSVLKNPDAMRPSPSRAMENSGTAAVGAVECQTCKNRTYQDGSDDATVSFQNATHIDPGAAESLVRAHEQEHVSHERVRAKENGSEVVSQNVAIHYQTCPECGRSYVAGGTTTTVTRSGAGSGAGRGDSGEAGGKGVSVFA